MRHLIFFIIILISINVFSQDFERIKKQDTIYVLFKGGKFEKKTVYLPSKDGFKGRVYELGSKSFFFEHLKYINVKEIANEPRREPKNFIRKNKNKIIRMKFLEKYERCLISDKILSQNKIFYIIDCTEKKDGKINLYQVMAVPPCLIKYE